jgi:hypothetical protein
MGFVKNWRREASAEERPTEYLGVRFTPTQLKAVVEIAEYLNRNPSFVIRCLVDCGIEHYAKTKELFGESNRYDSARSQIDGRSIPNRRALKTKRH